MFSTILIFIIVLGLLVFVHEAGHFTAAKKMGMKVEEFGFGFPPRAFGLRRKGDETIYSLNWIPLGGFVKIKGESGEHRNDSDSFASKPAWKRFIVLVAGVVMNLVLAAVLLSVGFMIGLPSVIDDNTPASAQITEPAIRVIRVIDESPAAEGGLMVGEKILTIDGRTFEDAESMQAYIEVSGGEGIEMLLEKDDGSKYTVDLTSEMVESEDFFGIGVGLIETGIVAFGPIESVYRGTIAAASLTWEVVRAFYNLLVNLVVRQEVGVDLSGPVGIAVLTGEVAALGFVYLLQFTAILSINLAVINILPFPALDGGRVLFLLIEKIKRGPVDEKIEAVVHNIGFMLLMLLVVLVTYRDLVKYGGQIWGALKGIVGV